MTVIPEPNVLWGEFTVAVKDTFQSRQFPYSGTQPAFDNPGAPPRVKAYQSAYRLYRKVKKANPDRVVRLIDRPFVEFFV